jgi:hypothetical protein
MTKENSLIDSDFIDGGSEVRGKDTFDKEFKFPEPREIDAGQNDRQPEEIEIKVVDDTPDTDKGRWVANDEKDGEPELPDDKEVRGYSQDVQKRFGQLTARVHAERRAKEEELRAKSELENVARRLLAENNKLKEVLENGEKVMMGEHKARLDSELNRAKAQYKEAAEAQDSTGMLAAQEAIARAIAQMERAAAYRPQALEREKEEEVFRQRQVEPQVNVSEKAKSWQEKNPWFLSDDLMTTYALALHRQMVNEGVEPDGDAYYKRLDKDIRQRFPDRFKSAEQPRRQGAVVAPASRQEGNSQRRVVQLTETQVRLAKRLGLTPHQYAEQILAEQGNSDGKTFTHL